MLAVRIINRGASFRWSFGPLSAWGSIESTTISTTHLSYLVLLLLMWYFDFRANAKKIRNTTLKVATSDIKNQKSAFFNKNSAFWYRPH